MSNLDLSALTPEARALVEATLEENASLRQQVAENAPKAKRLQGNGFLTCPKGAHQDWIGKEVEVEHTIKVRGVVGQSKNGNACLRLTFKVPEDQVKIIG